MVSALSGLPLVILQQPTNRLLGSTHAIEIEQPPELNGVAVCTVKFYCSGEELECVRLAKGAEA